MADQTKKSLLFFFLFFLFLLAACAKTRVTFKPRPAPFPLGIPAPEFAMMRVEVNGQRVSPLVPTLFLLPEDPLVIQIQGNNQQATGDQDRSWSVKLNSRFLASDGNNRFSGTVPEEPGFYPLEIESRQKLNRAFISQNISQGQKTEKIRETLQIIVLHPFSRLKDGVIERFPIGIYPDPDEAPEQVIPKAARSNYLPPKGFIEVTDSNQKMLVSQHYCLKDFISHLNTPFPQFIALSPALLLKLEWLTLYLEQYSQNPKARLTILSGFRTPKYNQMVSGARLEPAYLRRCR